MTSQSQLTMDRTTDGRAASALRGAGRGRAGRLGILALVLTGVLMTVGPRSVTARSLYVIAETLDGNQQVPLLACDIGSDGTLTRQAKKIIPLYGAGAVGLAMDSTSQDLFVSYKTSNVIVVLDATTLNGVGTATAQGAHDMAGIVYDNDKGLLYCAARGTASLYIYQWKATTNELIPAPDSPVQLEGAQAYGITLDEVNDELYVGGQSTSVSVYSTYDWHLIKTISVGGVAMSVAVDPVRKYLYYGGGLVDDYFLVRHDLVDDTEKQVRIGAQAGVVGLAVDLHTGFVFASTGSSTCYCGHELRSFSSDLTLIDTEEAIGVLGNPGGVVVPDGHISYNPLRLTKTIKTSTGSLTSDPNVRQVTVGEELTYAICFDHNDLPLTEVSVVDSLPAQVSFVRATGDGTYGQYDDSTHTYTWSNPPLAGGPQKCLELVCRMDPNTPAGLTITNSVTIRTRETPPTTTEVDVVTVPAQVYKPLHVTKTVIGGAMAGVEATLPSAYAGDEVTYRITFDNNDNPYPVEHVRLTDNLPPQVTFVRAADDILYGRYDATTRSYTWSYPELAAHASKFEDLVVRLNDDAVGGTTFTNTATISSDTTSATKTSVGLAVASSVPLWLQKTLSAGSVGHPDSQGRPYVDAGSTITYALSFINPATNKTMTQVSLVDTLPREVTFVSADGDGDFGAYDAGTDLRAPTYTWRYASLVPGTQKTLHLTVRVSDKLDPNSVISNAATISAVQTPSTKASLDVLVRAVPVAPLYLQKTLTKGTVGQPDSRGRPRVDPGSNITYTLTFSNPATNPTVTQVSLVDTLPREVTFVSADGGNLGSYNAGTQTYTWRSDSLVPGVQKYLNLTVRVNDKLDPNTVISNAATISASQATPTKASVDVVVRAAKVQAQDIYIKPDHIYRSTSIVKSNLMIVVHLPEGIGMGAISNASMVLTPGNVPATGQLIFGTSTQGKVLGFFDVGPILTATQGTPNQYGECPVTVVGNLNDGRSFYAQGSIWILSFGGP